MTQKSAPLLRYLGTDKSLVETVVQVGEAYWDVSLNKFYVWTGTAWQEVAGGGVSDHSLLSNLDYDSAGHTGFASKSTADTTIYVDAAATGAGDGTSWTDAFTSIQSAVNSLPLFISNDITIKVNGGTYTENIDLAGHSCVGTLTIKAEDTSGNQLYDNGLATGGSTTEIDDTGKAWATNAFAGGKAFVYDGTNEGEIRDISSNTATSITVSSAFPSAIDTTSRYVVLGLVNVSGTFINSNLDNFNMYGLSFEINAAGAVAKFSGVKNVNLDYCSFVNNYASGNGLVISYSFIEGWFEYIKADGFLTYIQAMSYTGVLKASLAEALNSGSGYGLFIEAKGFESLWSNAGYSCFKNLQYGVWCHYGANTYQADACTYINCTNTYNTGTNVAGDI